MIAKINKSFTELFLIIYFVLFWLEFYTNVTQQRLRGNVITYKMTYCEPYDPCTSCMHNGLPHFASLIISSAWTLFRITCLH